jgi:UDP-N-acetylglucosamine--N-acetylmuramyl-(pentapeptide) pyrophosphoryl-undecaprenol N-acetylglucosamine transferase
VRAGQIRGKSPLQVTASAGQIARGVREARGVLKHFAADAIFATGGYASMPVVLAAALTGTPVTVFLPDIYPGWAVRVATRLAAHVATTADGALEHLPRQKTSVTGYPLRPEFWEANRTGGRDRLELREGPCLLISGASSGSRVLNDAVSDGLVPLLQVCQVVHLTGSADESRMLAARKRLPQHLQRRYHVHGYLSDIAWAMAAADLAVLRAGASCLAEPPAVGLPAILVPGSFSDQYRNAAYMAAAGAAVVLEETRLSELPAMVEELVGSADRLAAMSLAANRLARPSAAEDIVDLLLDQHRSAKVPEACAS